MFSVFSVTLMWKNGCVHKVVAFMESGHSYLEADSTHTTIERACRHQKIYTTRVLEIVVRGSRRKAKPYTL